ncbi:MAG: hypothetical protein ABJA67_03550 [Chthonomonadales bacterium]
MSIGQMAGIEPMKPPTAINGSGPSTTRLTYFLWVSGGFLETIALVVGFFWIMNNPESHGLKYRVIIVAALAVLGGGLSMAGAVTASKIAMKKNSGDGDRPQ